MKNVKKFSFIFEKAFFSQFGEITEVFCVKQRGFGFVTMVEDGDNIKNIMETGFFDVNCIIRHRSGYSSATFL